MLKTPKPPGFHTPSLLKNPFQPDAQYVNDQAQGQFNVNQGLVGLNQANTIDQADTRRAATNLAQRQVQSQQGMNGNAARNGALMSGRAMQNYGYMNQGYQQQQNSMGEALKRRVTDRTQQASNMQAQQGLNTQAQNYGLVDRNRQRLAQQLSMMIPMNPYQAATKNQWVSLLSKQLGTPTISPQGIVNQ
jgi:hypothetical protein